MDPYWTSRDGRHCLYLGDCLDVLPGMEPGSVITDPPYGISHATHGQLFRSATPIAGDDTTELAEIVFEWFRARNTTMCMFYSPYKPFGDWRSVLVWNKGAHVGIGGDRETCWKRDFEMIGVRDNSPLNGMRDSAVLSFMALLPPPSGHFAEKPVPLMEYLVEKLTQPGDTVFDPFAGSATTGVACIRTGRRFVGVEIERRYADIAVRRMERELSQPHLPGLAPHEAVDVVRELFGEGTQ